MRKESAGVTEALLKSAQLEFLTHGFHDASLRRISAGSGVSTNSIIHVMCRTGWQYIYEIVSHDLPHEEAVDFMKNIRRYFYAGWQNVLGIEVLKKEPEKKNYKD